MGDINKTYLERFGQYVAVRNEHSEVVQELKSAPHDQARVALLMRIVSINDKLNALVYDMFCDVSNVLSLKVDKDDDEPVMVPTSKHISPPPSPKKYRPLPMQPSGSPISGNLSFNPKKIDEYPEPIKESNNNNAVTIPPPPPPPPSPSSPPTTSSDDEYEFVESSK